VLRVIRKQFLQHVKVFYSAASHGALPTTITTTASKTPITSQTAATLAVTRPERPHVAADDGRTLSCQLYLPKKVTCCTAAAAATVAVAAACGLVVLAAAAAFGGEGRARYVAASDDPYTAAAVQEYKEAQGVHEIKADADVPAKG